MLVFLEHKCDQILCYLLFVIYIIVIMIIVLVPVLAQRLNSIHYHFNYARRAIPKQVSRTVIMVIKQKCKSN